MKDLIVYYSLEGNTEYVVDKIKAVTGADCLCLIPKKAYHDKAFAKLAKTLGIDKIEKTAVFIDPKSKPNKEKDAEIETFAEMLK